MLELLKRRRSTRLFTDQPVSEEDLDSLLKAALLAPSSMGKRPVECVVVRDRETIARLKTYKKHGTTALESAPLAIVVAADAQKSDVWVEDASIAATFLQVEAEALGLGSNWIQLRRRESDTELSEVAFRRELGLPITTACSASSPWAIRPRIKKRIRTTIWTLRKSTTKPSEAPRLPSRHRPRNRTRKKGWNLAAKGMALSPKMVSWPRAGMTTPNPCGEKEILIKKARLPKTGL
ncbi:MAG: nitroreductase family protein [Bilophila sp.]